MSSTPVQLEDGSLAYSYSGRANFGYQQQYADKEMQEFCKTVNGGTPLVVQQGTSRIGAVGTATAMSTSMISAGVLANMQKEVLFKCVT